MVNFQVLLNLTQGSLAQEMQDVLDATQQYQSLAAHRTAIAHL